MMNIQDQLTPENIEEYRGKWEAAEALSERCRTDSSLRDRLDGGDVSDALTELGLVLPPGIKARIVADTPDTVHFIMPPNPNIDLSDEALSSVAGGCSASPLFTSLGGKTAGDSCCLAHPGVTTPNP